jgi:hypothetical protein
MIWRRVELCEELIGGGLAPALAAPHHAPASVVADEREVAVALAPGDLVDPDRKQIAEPVAVQQLLADALDDPPDRVPVDPGQPAGRALIGLRRQPRDQVLEITREPSAVTGERNALHVRAVLRADKPPQPSVNLQPPDPRDRDAARPSRDAACSPDAAWSTGTSGTEDAADATQP